MVKPRGGQVKLGADFYKLWASNAISTLGDGALLAAGPLLVASHTQNPAIVAGAVFMQELPWLLFSLLAGAYADRVNHIKILVQANAIRTIAISGLAIAIVAGNDSIAFIYTALFLLGTGDTLADNGTVALLPSLVKAEQLERANSRLQSANILGRQLLGPSLGACLFAVAAAIPFGFDAATFVIATIAILKISPTLRHTAKTDGVPPKPIRHDIQEGLTWLWSHSLLRTIAITNGVLNLTFMAAFASFVLYVHQQLGLGALGYGLLLSATALGGLVGAVVAPMLQRHYQISTLVRAALITEACIDLSFAATHSYWVAGILYVLFGIHTVIWAVTMVSLRQRIVPASMLGRVNSVYNLFKMGGLAIGALIGGLLAHSYGITAPFWTSGVAVLVLTVFVWHRLSTSAVEQ